MNARGLAGGVLGLLLPVDSIAVAAEPAERPAKPARTDVHGDPLPDGAVGRLGTVRMTQGGGVHTAAFSTDGRLIASAASWSATVWDVESGQELPQFKGKLL